MKLFYKLFVFSFALLSTWSIKAERIEVILHDNEIKLFLADQGLDLDTLWEKCFNQPGYLFDNSDLEVNALLSKFKQISQENPDTSFDFPETKDSFDNILDQLGFTYDNGNPDNNQANEKNFNTLLADDENNRFEHTVKQLTSNNLRDGIIKAISSYFHQRAVSARLEKDSEAAKKHIHLYIKFVIDTDEQTITLQTCPYSSQTGFVKNYNDQEIKDLIATKISIQPTACNKVCNFIKGLTCATAVMVFVVVSAAIIIDPATVEEFIKALEENQ